MSTPKLAKGEKIISDAKVTNLKIARQLKEDGLPSDMTVIDGGELGGIYGRMICDSFDAAMKFGKVVMRFAKKPTQSKWNDLKKAHRHLDRTIKRVAKKVEAGDDRKAIAVALTLQSRWLPEIADEWHEVIETAEADGRVDSKVLSELYPFHWREPRWAK